MTASAPAAKHSSDWAMILRHADLAPPLLGVQWNVVVRDFDHVESQAVHLGEEPWKRVHALGGEHVLDEAAADVRQDRVRLVKRHLLREIALVVKSGAADRDLGDVHETTRHDEKLGLTRQIQAPVDDHGTADAARLLPAALGRNRNEVEGLLAHHSDIPPALTPPTMTDLHSATERALWLSGVSRRAPSSHVSRPSGSRGRTFGRL
jgi:hypothetical protein